MSHSIQIVRVCMRLVQIVVFLTLIDRGWAADAGDLRLRDGANTQSHFTAPGYVTLDDWQLRRESLRR